MPPIFVFTNPKGGVAKTTSTSAVGGALAERGQRVLMVDLDPQANLSLALGVNPHASQRTIADLLLHAEPPEEVILNTRIPEMDLIPANQALVWAERYLPGRPQYQTLLAHRLAALEGYDAVLIDTSPTLGSLTTLALAAAHLAIIPTQAEYFSAYALRHILGLIRQVRASVNPTLAYRVLITMFRRRNRAHRIIRARLEATFGEGLCHTVIETDTKLREAAIAGTPVTHFAPKTRAAEQYRALAQELLFYAQQKETALPTP